MPDQIDHQLLNLLQRDAGRTAEQLSDHIALSPSAIARRVRRLRKEGWIARTIALLSPKLTGNRLQGLLLGQWKEGSSRQERDGMLARMRADDDVQCLFEITGRVDVLMLVSCASMAELTALIDRHLEGPLIERHETHFIMRTEKFAPFVNLLGNTK